MLEWTNWTGIFTYIILLFIIPYFTIATTRLLATTLGTYRISFMKFEKNNPNVEKTSSQLHPEDEQIKPFGEAISQVCGTSPWETSRGRFIRYRSDICHKLVLDIFYASVL